MRVEKLALIVAVLSMVLPVSAGPFSAWSGKGLSVEFLGRGLESGAVLDLHVTNDGAEALEFQLPQLMVLEPANAAYAPILVESKGAWRMKPGADVTMRISGYSLDHSKKMPRSGQSLKYRPFDGGAKYQKAQYALKKSLLVEQNPGFGPVLLPKDKHRVLVIQRVIWRSHGGNNPKTPNALVKDLEAAFERAGKAPSEKAIQALAGSIWRDVEKVYKALAGS